MPPGCLATPVSPGVLLRGCLSATAFVIDTYVDGMDPGRGVTSYVYVFTQLRQQLRRGHQLRPVGLATVICQVSDSFRVRTGCYGQLAWFRLPDVPFFTFITSLWTSLLASAKCQIDPFYVEFITPADCSSWELQPSLCLALVLGRRNAAMAPGDIFYIH